MREQNRATFRIAAAQAAPVFLDRDGTVEKACEWIREAARNGAHLVVFPEAFIPGYPDWVWVVPSGRGAMLRELYAELLDESVDISSDATERLCRAAAESGIYVAIGVSERNVEASGTSLYNSMLYIDPQGKVILCHRKLVPTGGERLVWAQGDGSTLQVLETPLGRIGGLICWENYMPLARYALYAAGVQIYIASTWDHGEAWLATLRHIAREGRCIVIGCCTALRRSDIPDRHAFKAMYARDKEWINTGDSAIVAPDGKFLAGPVNAVEQLIYADVQPNLLRGSKWDLDVAGHYARPDVFQLHIRSDARPLVRYDDDSPGVEAQPVV
jgi:nitrilase